MNDAAMAPGDVDPFLLDLAARCADDEADSQRLKPTTIGLDNTQHTL